MHPRKLIVLTHVLPLKFFHLDTRTPAGWPVIHSQAGDSRRRIDDLVGLLPCVMLGPSAGYVCDIEGGFDFKAVDMQGFQLPSKTFKKSQMSEDLVDVVLTTSSSNLVDSSHFMVANKYLKLYGDSYSKALRTKSACPHKIALGYQMW
jgi:hypothetical protein